MKFSSLNIQDLELDYSIDVNAASGSTSVDVSIPLSESRAGFNPSLSLQYSSSPRNSIFGIGWSLAGLPFFNLDTSRGLPKHDGSDNYAFNGSNSLIPYLVKNGTKWEQRIEENADNWIYYYRPKLESSFTRFEKWVNKADGSIHWRTRSKTNVISIYGLDSNRSTKIFDPENPKKVVIWFLETQYDDNGNAIIYQYKSEDSVDINHIDSFETNRLKKFNNFGFAQKYPEKILYGNTKPIKPDNAIPQGNKWLFEIIFDYGEYSQRPYTDNSPTNTWNKRQDPFSIYNNGFEIRTYRLCQRILMYHHFNELSPTSLVGIFSCKYNDSESGTTLASVSFSGVRKDLINGTYSEKSLPALKFKYTQPSLDSSFQGIIKETNDNLPQGFNSPTTQIVDILGEGIPGILTESNNAWYYKSNMGNGLFGKQEIVINKPSHQTGLYALGDFDHDGNLNFFSLQGRAAGYYEYDRDSEKWLGFTAFKNIPQVDQVKFMDTNSNGLPDLIIEKEDKIVCYPFKGKEGFGKPSEFSKPLSNGVAYAPTIGNDLALDYFMADMTGDGLPDQVRIKNGRVEYFPNLGNAHFGEGIVMENPPVIDFEDSFDASRIRLYDLDGSGTSDILYIGNGEIRYWYNASGNKFIEGNRITNLPYIDNISSVIILDFLGNGTPCLVWSNSLNHLQYSSIQYLQLTNGIKPRLLSTLENSMCKEVKLEYSTSASHYLTEKESSSPWISKLPGHFTVVDKKEIIDHISNTRFVSQYKYKDGHYDGKERSFVTFGLVEQYDTEFFINADPTHEKDYAQPSCLKTWFHSGIFADDAKRVKQYYDKDAKQSFLVHQSFEDNDALGSDEFGKAYRSLAGRIIRQELFATSAEGEIEEHPYQISQTSYKIRKLQPKTKNHDSSFLAYQSESVVSEYEQNPDDPRISHYITVSVDKYGEIEKELNIAYARRSAIIGSDSAQKRDYITASIHKYIHSDRLEKYETGILYEGKDFEINQLNRSPDTFLKLDYVRSSFDDLISNAIAFDTALPTDGSSRARLITWNRTFFWDNAFSAVLPLGQVVDKTFSHHEESACFNDSFINQVYGTKVTNAMLTNVNEGNYEQRDEYWWQKGPTNYFLGEENFYRLNKVEQLNGSKTEYTYDQYFLNIIEINNPLGNLNKGEIDYNIIEPYRLIDQNDNISEVLYDSLGVIIASFSLGTVLDENNIIQKYGNGRLSEYSVRTDESFESIIANSKDYLQQADTYFFYQLDNGDKNDKPLCSISINRENLIHDGKGNIAADSNVQISLTYIDGFGRTLQSKQKVEPGNAIKRLADNSVELDVAGNPVQEWSNERWLVSGHLVYNNKQQPVRQFESFFSSIIEFENDEVLETYGVAAHTHYDAVGRELRTDFPNSTFVEVKITAWEIQSFDQNDTVDRSFYKVFREIQPTTSPERLALDKALAHKETPTIIKLDPLGREIIQIEVNNDNTEKRVETRYDMIGNISEIIDARNLIAFVYKHDMLGRTLFEKSNDAGEIWNFHNSLDQTIHLWDGRNIHQRTRYDDLDRVTTVHVEGALDLNQITERFIYGENNSLSNKKERNLRGQLVTHYDQAGIFAVHQYTPSDLPMNSERKLLDQFRQEPDWTNPAIVALDTDIFTSKYVYDGLGRMLQQELPDQTTRKFIYHQGGGVQKVLVSTADGVLTNVEILKETAYDEKGLRQRVLLGNDIELNYSYDVDTFRMTRLHSRKTVDGQRTYQDIEYTYDPVGNLVYFIDQAQQPDNAASNVVEGLNVSAHSEFEYDALYQLKFAKGRVHQALLQQDYQDRSRENNVSANWGKGTRHISLNNGASVERYTRQYEYDTAGNIKSIKHIGSTQNWTKQIWNSQTSNRSLPLNDLNGNVITNPESRFDENGNCIYMPHLRSIQWNYRDNISKVVVIDRSAQSKPDDVEYYVYGGDGIRVRKITQRVVDVTNDIIELTEKIYLDGCEIKRITSGGQEILKRFTSHISDGINKIALIHSWEKDTLARETDNIANKKIHYQLSNHLGSASLELDENGDIITYEEYFPFGGSSFIAGRNKQEIDIKDYRYCGKERDDFTGLYYFGYRYYAHWIGGWLSPDPIGPEDDVNLFLYVFNNPINLVDPNGLQSTKTIKDSGVRYKYIHFNELPDHYKNTEGSFSKGFIFLLYSKTDLQIKNWHMPLKEMIDKAKESGGSIGIYDPNRQQNINALFGDNPYVDTLDTIDSDPYPESVPSPSYSLAPSNVGQDYPGLEGGADAKGTGKPNDTDIVDTHNGTSGGTMPKTNDGGGGGNSGDGEEGQGAGGRGLKGTGKGGGGEADIGTGGNGGSGFGPGSGSGSGTDDPKGKGLGKPPKKGGVPGGTGDDPKGHAQGKIGGDPNNGTLGGRVDGSEEGRNPDGDPNGTKGSSGEGSSESSRVGSSEGSENGSPDAPENSSGSKGYNPDGKKWEDMSWWEKGLAQIGKVVVGAARVAGNIAEMVIEAGKELYDIEGLYLEGLGRVTGLWNYDHQVISGAGKAAEMGQGTGDILAAKVKGIAEMPGRFWNALKSGDLENITYEGLNLYTLGRSGYGFARNVARRTSRFLSHGRTADRFIGEGGFTSIHAGMGATSGSGLLSMSKGWAVRNSPIKYGLWRAGIAGNKMARQFRAFIRKFNPARYTSNKRKQIIGETITRILILLKGEKLFGKGKEVEIRVFGMRAIADYVSRTRSGQLRIWESKFGPKSDYTQPQLWAYNALKIYKEVVIDGIKYTDVLFRAVKSGGSKAAIRND